MALAFYHKVKVFICTCRLNYSYVSILNTCRNWLVTSTWIFKSACEGKNALFCYLLGSRVKNIDIFKNRKFK